MQISSIIDITNGELLNSPFISFIYAFKTDVKKVKEGDLFIAKNLDDIELAVKNGAFAILLEENYPIIDNEIAWIKVKNIEISVVQLIRYKLAIENLKAFYCDKATYDFFKVFSSNSKKNIVLIPNDLNKFFKILDDLNPDDTLIYHHKEVLDKIYPSNENLKIKTYDVENLIEHSLFETSFSYEDNYYSKLKIPSIYISQFLTVVDFLESELDFNKLKSFYNFKPLFLDKNLNLVEFGRSDKFLICQNDLTLIENEIDFLISKYKYAKTIFITSQKIDFLKENQIILKNIEDLKMTLKKIDFNAIYLIGFEYQEIHSSLTKQEEEPTLF